MPDACQDMGQTEMRADKLLEVSVEDWILIQADPFRDHDWPRFALWNLYKCVLSSINLSYVFLKKSICHMFFLCFLTFLSISAQVLKAWWSEMATWRRRKPREREWKTGETSWRRRWERRFLGGMATWFLGSGQHQGMDLPLAKTGLLILSAVICHVNHIMLLLNSSTLNVNDSTNSTTSIALWSFCKSRCQWLPGRCVGELFYQCCMWGYRPCLWDMKHLVI